MGHWDRYSVNVKNPDAKCTQGCMGRMEYGTAPCESGCCDSGYDSLVGLPDLPLKTPCARHEHVLLQSEGEP